MTEFAVERFGRHKDGYFHAWIKIDGKPFYVHRKHGSWLAPGYLKGRPLLKEIPYELKQQLQVKARAYEKANAPDQPDPRPISGGKNHA